MFNKFIKDFINKKFNIKAFAEWLNFSIWNRAIFVYTSATFSILVRYVLYSLHHDSWLPNSVTLYSVFFSYTAASIFLFAFGVLRNVTFGDYIRKFIDIDRIHENRIRVKKFTKLVVETHSAQRYFKVYSYNSGLTFGISFMLLAVTSGTSFAFIVSLFVIIFNLWVVFNVLYFSRYMNTTPVPDELKPIKPAWLLRLEDYNKSLALVNGVGNAAGESVMGSGFGKRLFNKVSGVTTRSYSYLTDPRNIPMVIKASVGIGTAIFGLDYGFADACQRTSYTTRFLELLSERTYSPDPDTRSKAAALRRRGIDLSDCCEPNSKYLNPELVENKYETVRPYETRRYLALEEKASALEQEKAIIEEERLGFERNYHKLAEEKRKLAEENRRLRLRLEGPNLE